MKVCTVTVTARRSRTSTLLRSGPKAVVHIWYCVPSKAALKNFLLLLGNPVLLRGNRLNCLTQKVHSSQHQQSMSTVD